MRELPLYVRHGDGHLAAILAVPDGEPRGVALLLAATEPTRVVGDALWARAARGLAGRGLASVRFDYEGQGESTGVVVDWALDDIAARVAQARSVLTAVEQTLGPLPVGIAGRCAGGRIGLALAAAERSAGLVWIDTPITETARIGGFRRRLRGSRLAGFVRSRAVLRRAVLEAGKRALPDTHRASAGISEPLGEALRRGPLLALCGEEFLREAGLDAAAYARGLDAAAGPAHRFRWELRAFGDDSLDAIAAWLAGALAAGS